MNIKNNPPRIAAIHDLSCFGRCALTVVLPIISAMGSQAIPIPTALLSTHTGGFNNMYFQDLTADMRSIIAHFEKLSLSFDAIYSGFLGSAEQIDIVSDFIDRFGDGKIVLVDPVMGDDGTLYQTYTQEMARGMVQLCHKAEIITPNLTEACFMTDTPLPQQRPSDQASALELAGQLCEMLKDLIGDKKIIITGIRFNDKIGNVYKEAGGPCRIATTPYAGEDFPGSGEVFSSVLLGELMRDKPFASAVERAAQFTFRVITETQAAKTPRREGVLIEKFLFELSE